MSSGSDAGLMAKQRKQTKYVIAAATAANATFILSIQVLGLLTLAPADFGVFSIQYLFFALASSMCLSIICEPWLRRDLHEKHVSSWHEYSSVLLYISLLAGAFTVIASMLIPSLRVVAVTGGIGVLASTYRAGARYHEVRVGNWPHVLLSDVSGLIVTIAVWCGYYLIAQHGLWSISVAWAVGSLTSAVLSPLPRLLRIHTLFDWFSLHRRHIVPLLRDSILMDLGAIGTPFGIAPILGIANFGVYRAVSNVAAPVRLILNPIRPTLAAVPLATHRSPKRILGSVGISVVLGMAAFAALMIVRALQLHLGSLTAVVAYAIPTAVFVTANFLGHYYFIIARTHASGGSLLVGRITQTCLAIMLPIIGALIGGLPAAIWGYAIATAISGITWFALITLRLRLQQPAHASR